MINDGLGHKEATITGELSSKAQVHIFVIGKKGLIKETDSLKKLLTIESSSTASAEYISGLDEKF